MSTHRVGGVGRTHLLNHNHPQHTPHTPHTPHNHTNNHKRNSKGYQGKRIDNTSVRDDPYEFTLGAGDAIGAFEEAVSTMKVGGIRRIEVPGDRPELGYSLDRSERFTDELISKDLKIFKFRRGPQPKELGGQRALDFVLDNSTLRDFNRTLLFDIKLLSVYSGR